MPIFYAKHPISLGGNYDLEHSILLLGSSILTAISPGWWQGKMMSEPIGNSTSLQLTKADQASIKTFKERAKLWAIHNNCLIGVAEVALGAALLAWGINNGAIEVGSQIVGSVLSPFPLGGVAGAFVAGSIGATAAAYIGSIGIAAAGTAIGVPALMLIGAGSAVFASFGYTAGDLTEILLQPSFVDLLGSGSATLVGVALIVDGCRRLIQDEAVLRMVSELKNGAIWLTEMSEEAIASSLSDLQTIAKTMAEMPVDALDAIGGTTSGVVAGAAGAAIATTTVTVLGSSTLGTAAVALGLVSAPIWPVIAGGSAGLAVGYGVWKAVMHFTRKSSGPDTTKIETPTVNGP